MLDGLIRATKYHNAIDPQVIYNQEIFKNVKIHILQQKNHNFFVKQVMKTGVISFNRKHYGLYSIEKKLQNYEWLGSCFT